LSQDVKRPGAVFTATPRDDDTLWQGI
jgi:hypothetical protein